MWRRRYKCFRKNLSPFYWPRFSTGSPAWAVFMPRNPLSAFRNCHRYWHMIQFSITSAFDIGLLLLEHLYLLFLYPFRLLPYRRSLALQLVHEFRIGVVLANGL